MTLDEAITDLSIQLQVKHEIGSNYQADAVALGIEALNCIKRNRANNLPNRYSLLPGETEK